AAKAAKGEVIPHVNEPNNVWLVNLAAQDIPAARLLDYLHKQAAEAARTGATGVVFYNGKISPAALQEWGSQHPKALTIPVLWVSEPAAKQWMGDDVENFQVNMKAAFEQVHTTGVNVLGFIDNGAPQTVIIGAPYDYLPAPAPQNEDKASAAAALLELGRQLKNSKLRNNNYLLIAFSGEEEGTLGDRHFAQHPAVDSNSVNYFLKLDRLGGLTPQKGLQVQVAGNCPVWKQLLDDSAPKGLKVNYDSSAPAQKNMPALVFSAPADAGPLNYNGTLDIVKMIYHLIEKANGQGKLARQ
ncbi:MAG TPA: M28 family peptidase, partial [Chitinophaga sp.]